MEPTKLRVETGIITVEVEDERGRTIGQFDFNPADSNILKRYGAVVDFFNTLTLADGETEEERVAAMNALADSVAKQFDFLLGPGVAEGTFAHCGPLTVTKSGDFFFEQVLVGIGDLIERTTKQRVNKKLEKIHKAVKSAPRRIK